MRSSFSLAPVLSTSPHFLRVFFFLSISLLSSTIRCWWLIVYFPSSGLESTTSKSFIERGVERPGSGSQMFSLLLKSLLLGLSAKRGREHTCTNSQMYKSISIVLSVTYLKLWVYSEISNPKLKSQDPFWLSTFPYLQLFSPQERNPASVICTLFTYLFNSRKYSFRIANLHPWRNTNLWIVLVIFSLLTLNQDVLLYRLLSFISILFSVVKLFICNRPPCQLLYSNLGSPIHILVGFV